MIVVVANYIPDAVRGKMKLWFTEAKPNVFVSGIRDSIADNVIDLMMKHCPPSSGLIIFKSESKPPYYRIFAKGQPSRNLSAISGLQLIVENLLSEGHAP